MTTCIQLDDSVPTSRKLHELNRIWKRRKNVFINIPKIEKKNLEEYVSKLIENHHLEVSQVIMAELLAMNGMNEGMLRRVYSVSDIGNMCEIAMREDVPSDVLQHALESLDSRLVEAAAMSRKATTAQCKQRLVSAESEELRVVLTRVLGLKMQASQA